MAKRQKASDEAREFFRSLASSKKPKPVYLLYGQEGFLLDMALSRVKALVLPGGINDFNYDIFYGKDLDPTRVVAACDTLALMGGQRLVVVKEIHRVAQPALDPITNYLANPCPSTSLVCHGHTQDTSIRKTSRFYKTAAKKGVAHEFRGLREWEVGTFLHKQAKGRGLKLSSAAEEALVKAVGPDLALLDAALEKIDLYMGPSDSVRKISEDDLVAVVAVTRSHDVFELTDTITGRDLAGGLKLIDRMLLQGQSAIGINLMVARQMRQLLAIKVGQRKGLDKYAKARAAGVSPFFVDRLTKHAALFSDDELRQALKLTLYTDRKLKSSRLSDRTLIEQMVINICTGKQEEEPRRGA